MDRQFDSSISSSIESRKLLKKIKEDKRRKFIEKYKKMITIMISVVIVLIIAFSIIDIYFYSIYKVESTSMMDTIDYGDSVLIKKQYDKIEAGKVYEFKKDDKKLLGRCIATGGDHVKIINDKVYINNVLLAENYVSAEATGKITINVLVPEGSVLFLGDNRADAWDARYWSDKFIDESDIIGEATRIILPFKRTQEIKYY